MKLGGILSSTSYPKSLGQKYLISKPVFKTSCHDMGTRLQSGKNDHFKVLERSIYTWKLFYI